MKIYMDNGATSFPKAPGVTEAMVGFLEDNGSNVGRSTSASSFEAQRIIYETREMLAQLVGFDDPSHVVFTKNVTESLNVLLKGLLRENDHVIVSPLEHNAVMRPLSGLKHKNVTFSRAACDDQGRLIIPSIEPLIQPNTRLIVMTHGSNVCGSVLDLEAVGRIARSHGLIFIVDCAQTLGVIPVSMVALGAHALAFTGHKGLLGPTGTGGFIIEPALAQQLSVLIEGGTGSLSESEDQPDYMPDKFEAGTPNTVGIYGLHGALRYILSLGHGELLGSGGCGVSSPQCAFDLERKVTERFLQGVLEFEGLEGLEGPGGPGGPGSLGGPRVRVIGPKDLVDRTGLVSLDFVGLDNAEVCFRLDQEFGIVARVGMHCSPAAHRALGTYPGGTVRFSFSVFTTMEEVELALAAIGTILGAK